MEEHKHLSTTELEWDHVEGVFPNGLATGEKPIALSRDYRPSDDEEFMNPNMREYFRQKLLKWRQELLEDNAETLDELKHDNEKKIDPMERASAEQVRSVDFRHSSRQRKLIGKINNALIKIANHEYGFCEETKKPIGIKRLEARPIATLSLEAQKNHEEEELTYNDEV